uniref:OTU domain-containing protein n=1 Tax=viral metagenome TaxID=1070528 RepID=A0A6C0LRI3_9ZZZZ
MVKSIINPDIEYSEINSIDKSDIDYESTVYDIHLYDNDLEIALGKEIFTKQEKGIIFYSIYLLLGSIVACKIGIFEIESDKFNNILDTDNDIDLKKGNILYFNNEHYVRELINEYNENNKEAPVKIVKEEPEKDTEDKTKVDNEEEVLDKDNSEDENEDVFKLNITEEKKSKQQEKTDEKLKEGIFEIDNSEHVMKLPEETKEDSEKLKDEYIEKSKNKWIETFMKNNNYDVEEKNKDGNCFFETICKAYEQIGYHTTIDKLRALLANEATEELYEQYRTLYVSFLSELQDKDKQMGGLKKIGSELKKRNQRTQSKEESKELLNQAEEVIEKYNKIKVEKEDVKDLLEEFKFMEGIDSLERLKTYIQTSNYWADTWAISTLERLLNVKIIIMSQNSYENGDIHSVLQCGQLNDTDLEKQGKFSPDYYIMADYDVNHYELITYKKKKIFKFSEVPYDIKVLIINKCMEKNSGPYYLIRDFRNFKTKLGLPADEGAPVDDVEDIDYDKYDPETVFVFYSKSAHTKAGNGSGETIKKEKMTDFNILNKDKMCVDWRKKIDDSWVSPFTVDGKRWASVEHYFQGSQYKKGFPDFYAQFSLDSESELSNDVALAKKVGSKPNKKYKLKQSIPDNIVVDEDFYEVKQNPRHEEARLNALMAKFSQNLDLKKVLMETKNAKLMRFKPGNPAEVDELLIKVRRQLQKA